jgi:hypothetical protein
MQPLESRSESGVPGRPVNAAVLGVKLLGLGCHRHQLPGLLWCELDRLAAWLEVLPQAWRVGVFECRVGAVNV